MGFEPTVPFGTHRFQRCAIDHSANPPMEENIVIYLYQCKSILIFFMHKKTLPIAIVSGKSFF